MAGGEDLSSRAVIQYQFLDNGLLTAAGLSQTYDLGYQRQVSVPLGFQLFFRGAGLSDQGGSQIVSGQSSSWRLEPLARFYYSLPKLQFGGYWSLSDTIARYPGGENQRQVSRLGGSLSWRPDDLPSLALFGGRRSARDAGENVDWIETTATEGVDYTFRALNVGELGYYTVQDFQQSDFTRKTAGLQGRLQYQNSFFGGNAFVSASLLAGWSKLEEQARSQGSVSVPTAVPPTQAYFVFDDTPLDGRDHPLVETSALIDGNLDRSAGVNIGPESRSFQNIAVEVGRFVGLDAFRISVRDPDGHPITNGGLVRWDVYTSVDKITWVPASGTATRFSPVESLYEVTFALTTSRFFKAVSFGTALVDTEVTEIQAFYHTAFSSQVVRRTDIQFENGAASVAGSPAAWLHLSADALYNRYQNAPEGRVSTTSTDSQIVGTAEIRPLTPIGLFLQYRHQDVQGAGFDRTYDSAGATLRYDPNANLAMSLSAFRNTENRDRNLATITSDNLNAHLELRPFRSMQFILDGGSSRQSLESGVGSSERRFLSATGSLQLTNNLRFNLLANLERVESRGASLPDVGFRPNRSDRVYGELWYRSGQQLILSALVGYAATGVFTQIIQNYQLQWYPFGDGALSIGLIYNEDIDQNDLSRRFRRVQIAPRWTLNRHAFLEMTYNYLRTQTQRPGIPASQAIIGTIRTFGVSMTLSL